MTDKLRKEFFKFRLLFVVDIYLIETETKLILNIISIKQISCMLRAENSIHFRFKNIWITSLTAQT
jgi:hypothetical protein